MTTYRTPDTAKGRDQPDPEVRDAAQRGACPDTDGWEVYHQPPTGDPDSWRTEIVQPYRLTTPATRR